MAKIRIPCTKCSGNGYIAAFRHIQGGVCFSCGGHGYRLVSKSYKPSTLYSIIVTCVRSEGCNLEVGQRGTVFNLKARTAAEALKKAKAKWTVGGNYWFDPSTAEAVEV